MKRRSLLTFSLIIPVILLGAQTIDKPAATLKLLKQEVISVRQAKADFDKIEVATGAKLTLEQRKQVLDGKINMLLFFQYCEREKIFAPEADISAGLAQMKSSLGAGTDDARLEAALRSQGVFTDARSYVRQQLLFRNYLQAKRATELKSLQAPTSDEVLKEYDLAKASLVRPDTLRLSVIFVDIRGLSADDRAKAGDSMRQIANQLKSNPARFDEIVIRSSDPGAVYKATASVYVEKSAKFQDLYGPVFMDRVFKLKSGEVSELIENEAGLQIVRINEILPQKQLTLSDQVPGQQATVQDLIIQKIYSEKQSKLLDSLEKELIAGLRKEATVKIYDENLNF